MSGGLTARYRQRYLTLSVASRNGTDTAGSLADGLLGRLIRRLRIAEARHDLIGMMSLEAMVRKELAR